MQCVESNSISKQKREREERITMKGKKQFPPTRLKVKVKVNQTVKTHTQTKYITNTTLIIKSLCHYVVKHEVNSI